MDEIVARLFAWYDGHCRDLPWRSTRDPYYIWISEIILQQTRVAQGYDYFVRFIERFPTVKSLADAPEDDVMRMWQGLGYYSRARNLHHAAKQIVAMGGFPDTYDAIRSLKGVGDYTAAAIASFAFDIPKAAVDGNVCRAATPINIVENPKNLKFTELEAATMPRILTDVDAAVINGNYAIPAGLIASVDGLFVEGADSPYVNIIAVKDGNQADARVVALVQALQSQEIVEFIKTRYPNGEVVKVF